MSGWSGPEMTDFVVYWEAGRHLLAGEPIYTGAGMPFVYPPLAAVLVVPFALLPLAVAKVAWLALTGAALTVTVAVAFGIREPRRLAALTPAMCALGPVLDLVHFGQIGMLLVALCVVDCLRPWRFQGSLVGLAAGIKLLPALFVVHLWVTGRRGAAATAAGVFAASPLVLPGESWTYWTERAFDSRERSPAGASNVSLLGLFHHLPVPALACWAVAAAGLAAVWLRMVRRLPPVSAIAVTGLVSVLVSPVAWPHYLVWIVVAIAALARDGRTAAAAGIWVLFLPWNLPPVMLGAAAVLTVLAVGLPVPAPAQTRVAVKSLTDG